MDAEDLFSSIVRRIDRVAANGCLRAQSDAQLMLLALTTLNNLVLEKTRVARRLRTRADEGNIRESTLGRVFAPEAAEEQVTAAAKRILDSLRSEEDRNLVWLKFNDVPLRTIAVLLGVSEDALRQRWSRLRREIAQKADV